LLFEPVVSFLEFLDALSEFRPTEQVVEHHHKRGAAGA